MTNCMVKKSGFVDSGFVKTCDELVIGLWIGSGVQLLQSLYNCWRNVLGRRTAGNKPNQSIKAATNVELFGVILREEISH